MQRIFTTEEVNKILAVQQRKREEELKWKCRRREGFVDDVCPQQETFDRTPAQKLQE